MNYVAQKRYIRRTKFRFRKMKKFSLQVIMVHYLQRFCLITLCRRSNTTFHTTNVSTHTLFTDIPFSSALQFFHNHVRFYDNTFLRHVTSKYFIDAILLLVRSLLNYL